MASGMICEEVNTLTDTELNTPFTTATGTKILPSSEFSTADRESNGILREGTAARIVTSLTEQGVIPSSGMDASAYSEKVKAMFVNIKAEYCYYEQRYMYSLKQLFAAIRTQSMQSPTASAISSDIQKYLSFSTKFNQVLNDLIQIIIQITKKMRANSETIQTEMADLNKQLEKQQSSLKKQQEIIRSNEGVMKIQKQMVKYSSEKAKRTDNLLSMYSVMNVVVVGLLVYIYRAASDE